MALNPVPLTRSNVHTILEYFSELLWQQFHQKIRLVVHGGIVMVLHPRLQCRAATRDIDFILRSFITDLATFPDAEYRLKSCIKATADRFHLGGDWMNSDPDVALPWAQDLHGIVYDPIYKSAMEPTNVEINTIYNNNKLRLIGVSWSWAVALKLVRFKKDDPADIARILTLGHHQKGLEWTETKLENWLRDMCWPMNYDAYPSHLMQTTRGYMRRAIELTNEMLSSTPPTQALVRSAPAPKVSPTRVVQPVIPPSHHIPSAVPAHTHKHANRPRYTHIYAQPPPPPMPVPISVVPHHAGHHHTHIPSRHNPAFLLPPSSSTAVTGAETTKRRRPPPRPATPFYPHMERLPPIFDTSRAPTLKAF